VAAHEPGHTLGAVNNNASGHAHYADEWDVMCYKDAPEVVVQTKCADRAHDQRPDRAGAVADGQRRHRHAHLHRPAPPGPVDSDGRDGDAGGGSMRRPGRRAPASNAHDGDLHS
jgi:hypothetical protein